MKQDNKEENYEVIDENSDSIEILDIDKIKYSNHALTSKIILKIEEHLQEKKLAYIDDTVIVLRDRFCSEILQNFFNKFSEKIKINYFINFNYEIKL